MPLHIAWSGLRVLDLDRPRQRMSLYRTVLAEGMRDDLCRYLNKGILLKLWPVLHKLISTAIKDVWEEAFPELQCDTKSLQVSKDSHVREVSIG
ncbi:hypothetical protein QFZ24_009974 [Streptomyces phaeochromogenes]|uniref:transcriptional regulator n=1 Tax=Streptomyces phaeochromogenes TaxID=1923 RepID=UPI002792F58E|nr:transcriptional regulator [Streptomyces phaeochromogenes]MDQ0955965.1 hypothetical protein [Streptomyces phaeochromogenes]